MTSINDYSNILNPYISDIKSYINKYHNLEIEAIFNEPGFSTTSVSLNTFNKLYSGLNLNRITPIKSTDYSKNGIRKTVYSDNTESFINKQKFISQQILNFPIRIKVSEETPIEAIPDFEYSTIRIKTRYSIPIQKYLKLDLTIVEMQTIGEKKTTGWDTQTTYEVELELLDFSDIGLNYFVNYVDSILLKIYDSELIYTLNERNNILHFFNGLFSNKKDKSETLDYSVLVQARNLKLQDLSYTGLVGNAHTSYGITPKADGLRKLLIFHKSGIWLVHPPNEFNLIIRNTHSFNDLYDTILEGELIPNEKRIIRLAPKCKYLFLGFDCLSTRLNYKSVIMNPASVMETDKSVRLNIVRTISDKFLKNNLLQIYAKERIVFNTVSEFFRSVQRLFNTTFMYKTDGYIFEPESGPYNPHSEKIPLYKRNLKDYPDVCKWKPLEDLSIDFLVKFTFINGIFTPKLYSKRPYDFNTAKSLGFGKNENIKEFIGSKFNKYDYQMLNLESFSNINDNSIVEVALRNGKLSVIRVRKDKTKPNNMDIALDVWDDIFRPIEADTLLGTGFQLVKYYHNNIKRELFKYAAQHSDSQTLLDIGGGRGASVSQYYNFERVLVVEPDSDNILELNRRLTALNLHSKVRVLQCGGEESEIIQSECNKFLNGPASVITMNLSLSFFWSGLQKLQNLANTIITNLKSDGLFLFVTIDGESVYSLFKNSTQNPIYFGESANIQLFDSPDKWSRYIITDIRDSIVSNQKEWLVNIVDLQNLFLESGINLISFKKVDSEPFLNPDELKFTKLYSYGIFQKNNMTVNKTDMNKINFNTNALVQRTQTEYNETENYLKSETVGSVVDLDLQRFKTVKSPRANLENRPKFVRDIPIVNPLKSVVISHVMYPIESESQPTAITELLARINSPVKSMNNVKPKSINLKIPLNREPGVLVPTVSEPIVRLTSSLEVPVSQIAVSNIPPIPISQTANVLPVPLELESYTDKPVYITNKLDLPVRNTNNPILYTNKPRFILDFTGLQIFNNDYVLTGYPEQHTFLQGICNISNINYDLNIVIDELKSEINYSEFVRNNKISIDALTYNITNELTDYTYIPFFCVVFEINILILNYDLQPLYYSNIPTLTRNIVLVQTNLFYTFSKIVNNNLQTLFLKTDLQTYI
jgi:hypothetical protein